MKRSASASRSSVLIPGRRISRTRASVPATIRPARPMISTSRGDLRVIMLLAKSGADTVRDFGNGAHCRDPAQQVPFPVPLQHRRGLLAVGGQPGRDRLWIVVGTLLEVPPLGQPRQDLII